MDYSEREILSVVIDSISHFSGKACGQVAIKLTSLEDHKRPGPSVKLSFTIDSSDDETIGNPSSRILNTATALLSRLSRENTQSLLEKKLAWDDYLAKPIEFDYSSPDDGRQQG